MYIINIWNIVLDKYFLAGYNIKYRIHIGGIYGKIY